MNPWNRLFVVIAICWAIVSPLLAATEANRGAAQALHDCSDSAYQQYGSSDSPRFDVYRYIAEMDACNHATHATVSVFREYLARCSAAATGYLG